MTFIGILIPFIGTTLGAGCVLFFKKKIKPSLEKPLLGFSAGVMVAASVWSLLIPSIEQSKNLGKLSFFPATVGLLLGVGLLPIVDRILPKLKLSKAATPADAMALSIGIAIQNFPEGAIVSLPELAQGKSKGKAFLIGTLSGAVEPIFAVLTLLMFSIISPAMPYLLAFAAGAILFVVVDELIPEASLGTHNNLSTFSFAIGFCVMMILDVVFG